MFDDVKLRRSKTKKKMPTVQRRTGRQRDVAGIREDVKRTSQKTERGGSVCGIEAIRGVRKLEGWCEERKARRKRAHASPSLNTASQIARKEMSCHLPELAMYRRLKVEHKES